MNWLVFLTFVTWLSWLGLEAFVHRKRLKKIPHRLAVTGIRGKSSITRLIASGLRQAGFRVMAKTTGSKPVLLYPDGEEVEIKRRGRASILEQKKLIKEAVRQKADFLVSEMMSIQPECLRAETRYLLQPEILVISNFRPDHLEFLGKTREEIARHLVTAFPSAGLIFIPEEEFFPWMIEEARKKGSTIVPVRKNTSSRELIESLTYFEFEPNVRLATAVLEHCGLNREQIRQGLRQVNPDYGSLKIWRKEFKDPPCAFYFVNLFAANDPISSIEAMSQVIKKMGWEGRPIFGLFSFRKDRGDRTQQWLDFLVSGWWRREASSQEEYKLQLAGLAFSGPGSRAVLRSLKKSRLAADITFCLLKNSEPESCLQEMAAYFSFPVTDSSTSILSQETSVPLLQPEPVIFGLGNIVGFGQKMIDYLERTADALKL